MNVVISDTAEYGNYLFSHAAVPLLREKFMPNISTDVIGKGLNIKSNSVDNKRLIEVNDAIRNHPVEWVGAELRGYMTDMQRIVEAQQLAFLQRAMLHSSLVDTKMQRTI